MAIKTLFKRRSLVLLAIFICGVSLWQWAFMQKEVLQIDGRAVRVIDGDSFKSAADEFRIQGIDAPEYRQSCTDARGEDWACGRAARQQLREFLGDGQWSCAVQARDRFGRAIVICRDTDDRDLGSLLVKSGHALSGDHFDTATYGAEESDAKSAKRGIWQGNFDRPDQWRAENPRKS